MTVTRDTHEPPGVQDGDADVTEVLPRLPRNRSPRSAPVREPVRRGVFHGRLRMLLAAVATVLVLALIGGWLVFASPVFGVRTVRVVGLPASRSALQTQVAKAAGIRTGTPLVRLDTGRVVHVVAALPDVAHVSVRTSFPHTVTITVTVRTPVGYVREDGHDELVDRSGFQYGSTAHRPAGLPRLVVPDGTDARTTGGAVATVASSLPASLLRRVASVQALDPTAITVVLRDGIVVRWGSSAQSRLKGQVLPVLLKHAVTQVDLTDPHRPFTR